MKEIEEIREQLSSGKYKLSYHALKKVIERKIMYYEIEEAGENVIIIENYPEDKYSPSCLLLGYTNDGRPLHIQVSRMDSNFTKIITVYEPDEEEFVDYRLRRKYV